MKARIPSLVLVALVSLVAVASARPQAAQREARRKPVAPEVAVERLLDACLTRGQSYAKLRSLCEAAPHRLSGSDGAARAVEWARRQMLADGFENVRLEPVTVPHWVRGEVERLELTAPSEDGVEAFPILALGGSVGTPEDGIEAEVLMVRSFEELARRADEARGKIVFFNRPMDPIQRNTFHAYRDAVQQRVTGAVRAAEVGALAAIVRSVTMRIDDVPHTGSVRYQSGVEPIPAAAVSTRGAARIAGLLGDGQPVRLRLELSCETLEPKRSYNVVGELVGREAPDEVVVVGGHLDAWDVGQGAHDDGAGCVQAMEALRWIKDLGLRPRRTIRCVLFMNEENGLAGGNGYYAAHEDEMEDHVLAIESDRGAFTPRGFSAQVTEAALAELEALVTFLRPIAPLVVEAGGGGADIGPMAKSGVPLVGYVPDAARYFDFHHSAHDVLSAVHPRELELGTAAIAALAWLAAEREEPLSRGTAARR